MHGDIGMTFCTRKRTNHVTQGKVKDIIFQYLRKGQLESIFMIQGKANKLHVTTYVKCICKVHM